MANKTGIEWADATWNPWMGCHKVSAGCKNCYMFRDMTFYGRDPNTVVRTKTTFDAPLKWGRSGKVAEGARIFTCSWSDWFIEEADPWRPEAWDIIRRTPYFTYLILTKRPERIMDHLPADWGTGYPNVWLGVSAEDRVQADKRIPLLLKVPAAIRFISAEPLLGPIDIIGLLDPGRCDCDICLRTSQRCTASRHPIDWVITGGESDKKAPRPCNLDWVRSIRDQCQQAGVALFHKQHGGTVKVGGVWGGRVLDGRTWDEFPAPVTA